MTLTEGSGPVEFLHGEQGPRPFADAVPFALLPCRYGFTHIPFRGLGRVPGGHTQRPSEFIIFGGGQRMHRPFGRGLRNFNGLRVPDLHVPI